MMRFFIVIYLGLVVIAVWWILSCATSIKLKEALNPKPSSDSNEITDAFGDMRWIDLTAIQLLTEAVVLTLWVRTSGKIQDENCNKRDKTFAISVIGQLVGYLTTNAAFASISSSMALIIRACTPLFGIIAASLQKKESPNLLSMLFISTMCIGAAVYAISEGTFNTWGVCAAIIANIAFVIRNLTMNSYLGILKSHQMMLPSLSRYGFALLLPVVLLKLLLTQKLPLLQPTDSIAAIVSHSTHHIFSIGIRNEVVPATFEILDQAKRILTIATNLIYFQIPHNVCIHASLILFSIGSISYGLRTSRISKKIKLSVVFIVVCVVHYLTPWGTVSEIISKELLQVQRNNIDCGGAERITTSWVFDRPIPKEVVNNINTLQKQNPDTSMDVYCGTTQCIDAISSIHNPKITAQFLSIEKIVRDTPLHDWFIQHPVNKVLAGAEFEDHLQGVVQLALLWNRGGIYVNPTLQAQISNMTSNSWIVRETRPSYHSRAYGILDVSCFPRYDSFIGGLVGRFVASYPTAHRSRVEWPIQFDYRALQLSIYNECNNAHNCPVMLDIGVRRVNHHHEHTNHYGTLALDQHFNEEDSNLENELQRFPDIQFLPFVDKFMQSSNISNVNIDASTTVFLNGWWNNYDAYWPPNKNIDPILVSMQIGQPVSNFSNLIMHVDYLKTRAHVGCSDTNTLHFLRSIGIRAYFSGTTALMLQDPYRGRPRNDNIYLVGVTGDVEQYIPQHVLNSSITLPQYSGEHIGNQLARLVDAHSHLQLYSSAKLVITQRFDSALIAAAVGTPVIFIQSQHIPDILW